MSENMKSRQNRVRRNVTALVSAVALACGAVSMPGAVDAFERPEEPISVAFGPGNGSPAQIEPKVLFQTREQFDASSLKTMNSALPGQKLGYTVNVSLKAPKPPSDITVAEPGQSFLYADQTHPFVVAINTDPLAPYDQSGFKYEWTGLASGEEQQPLISSEVRDLPNGGKQLLLGFIPNPEFKDANGTSIPVLGKETQLRIFVPAQVSDDVKSGTELQGSSDATAYIFPYNWIVEVARQEQFPGECTQNSTYLFRYDGGGYGSWLMDVNAGSLYADNRTVKLEAKMFDRDPRDGTAKELPLVEPTPAKSANGPYFPAEVDGLPSSNYTWDTALDWVWDENSRTGTQWIQDGAWIQVTHGVENTKCAQNSDSYSTPQGRETTNSAVNVENGVAPLPNTGEYSTSIPVGFASVGDFVWEDANGNGIQDDGESGFSGVAVKVIPPEGSSEDTRNAKTDGSGNWKIEGLTPGVEYTVEFTLPDGYVETKSTVGADRGKDSNGKSSKVTLGSGEYNQTYDFGVMKETTTPATSTTTTPVTSTTADCDCTPVTVTKEIPTTVAGQTTTITTTATEVINDSEAVKIGDKVFIDKNGNGKQDADETEGVGGITVVITNTQTGNVSRTVTDKDGNWKAIGKPGTYEVTFEIGRRVASDPKLVTRTITLKPGDENFDIDLPVLPEGTVGDFVWNDVNGDGKQDQGEAGVPNVAVKVSRDGEPSRFAVTDKDGKWNIEGLTPNAEYTVTYIQPEGWNVTGKVPNATDQAGVTTSITLKPGEANNDIDLGLQRDNTVPDPKPGTLGGIIWLDGDRDGNNNGNDKGYEGIEVRIYEPGKTEPFKTTTTDKGGSWLFTGLDQGVDYRVEYNIPDGFDVTKQPDNTTVVNNKVELSITLDGNKPVDLDYDFGVGRSSTVVTKTVTTTVTAPKETITESEGSSADVLERCWANAVGSPLLYLTPIALLGALGGKLAEPYLGAVNQQLAQFNAQIQDAINRNTPDWGIRGRDGNRNDPFASFRAQINAANREMARIANDPQTRQLGAIAAGLIGLIAAGAVVYDWCSNEVGDAVTSSSKGDGATKPSTATEPATR